MRSIDALGLQRMAGNQAVARSLVGGRELPVQRDSVSDYLQQAWLAARHGGVVLALSAFMLKSAASQNSVDYVGYGYHLGPGDALRHCTWSALVMGSAIGEEMLSRSPPVSMRSREDIIAAATVRARGVLMAHEDIGDAGAPDSLMDQHNNDVGISLAVAAYQTNTPGSLAQDKLIAAARSALDGGSLTMFDPRTGERISTGGWRTFRPPGATDPWINTATPRWPAPAQGL